jgi:type IV pilus assembly protein PilA
MKIHSSGFTLIELMIVVAIVGILAAIALPAFQDYTARAQASEALKASNPLQWGVGIYLAENGTIAGINTDPSLTATAAAINGKYIQNAAITIAPDGSISVPFDAGSLVGETMILRPTLNGLQISVWQCAWSAGTATARWLPSGCR